MKFSLGNDVVSIKELFKNIWRMNCNIGLSVLDIVYGKSREGNVFTENEAIKEHTFGITIYSTVVYEGEEAFCDFSVERGYLTEGRTEVSPFYSVDSVDYLQGDTLPPFVSIDEYEAGSSGMSMFSIKFIIRDLKKDKNVIDDWVKKMIVDTNYRTRKNEYILNRIYDELVSPGIINYIKSFLSSSNMYSDNERGEIAVREGFDMVSAVASTADVGLDALDLLVDIVDYLSGQDEQRRVQKIEKVLTDPEKMNIMLGSALNSYTDKEVIATSGDGFDFSKYLKYIEDGKGNKFYISNDIAQCMPFRSWFDDNLEGGVL